MKGCSSPAITHHEKKRPAAGGYVATGQIVIGEAHMCNRIGTIVKHQNGAVKVIKLTCRSWNCETCRPKRKQRLIAEVKEGNPERLITLTVNPHWFSSPQERAEQLVKAWRLIRRRFLKAHPNAVVEFMAVFEKTKLGEPHLHICQRGTFMSQKWLSAQMHELMGAKIVDIRYIRSAKKVAEYVSKYIGKEPHQFGSLKRYWRSLKYHAMSAKAKRLIRNAGARFFIMEDHWKRYLRWMRSRFPAVSLTVGSDSFEFAWPDDRAPPWTLLLLPLGS